MKLELILHSIFSKAGEFVPTGTQVYGYPTEVSDHDFLVLIPKDFDVKNYIVSKLEENKVKVHHSAVFDCIKFMLTEKLINIIFLDDKNFRAWTKATRAMEVLRNSEEVDVFKTILTDRDKRIALFEIFVLSEGGDKPKTVYGSTSNTNLLGFPPSTTPGEIDPENLPF